MKYGFWVWLCIALGCAQEHERQPPASMAGAAGQASAGQSAQGGLGGSGGQGQAGQGGAPVDPQTRALILTWLDEYDRQAMGLCRCQVGWGDFPSLEQCFATIGTNESWRTCFLGVAPMFDTTGLRPVAECQKAQFKLRADCFDALGTCTKQNVGSCTQLDAMCPLPDPKALDPLIAACPQVILLH